MPCTTTAPTSPGRSTSGNDPTPASPAAVRSRCNRGGRSSETRSIRRQHSPQCSSLTSFATACCTDSFGQDHQLSPVGIAESSLSSSTASACGSHLSSSRLSNRGRGGVGSNPSSSAHRARECRRLGGPCQGSAPAALRSRLRRDFP